MIVKFNSLDRFEKPHMTLCNPGSVYNDGHLTNVVGMLSNHEAEEAIFNFNTSSELNFRIYRPLGYDLPPKLISEVKTVNGNPVYISDAVKQKVTSLKVNLSPVQDLNGYDHPWVGGAGVNKITANRVLGTISGYYPTDAKTLEYDKYYVGYSFNGYSNSSYITSYSVNGETVTLNTSRNAYGIAFPVAVTEGETYYVGATFNDTSAGLGLCFCDADGKTLSYSANVRGKVVTIPTGCVTAVACVYDKNASSTDVSLTNIMFNSPSTVTTWTPYENICPIYPSNEKNLLQITATTQTINGVTFTVNSDGSIDVDGTAMATAEFRLANLLDFLTVGERYILSGSKRIDTNICKLSVFNNQDMIDKGTGVTFVVASSGQRYLRIVAYSGHEIHEKFFPMIRRSDDSDPTYAPYQGIGVRVANENLLRDARMGRTNNGVTYVMEDGGAITMSGTASGNSYLSSSLTFEASANALTLIQAGTYTLSGSGLSNNVRMRLTGFKRSDTSTATNVTNYSANNETFTINEPYYVYLQIQVSSGTNTDGMVVKPMLVRGATAAEFVPYHATDYPMSLGSEVYGGTVDLATGVLTVTHKYVEYDGSSDEAWSLKTASRNYMQIVIPNMMAYYSANAEPPIISNIALPLSQNATYGRYEDSRVSAGASAIGSNTLRYVLAGVTDTMTVDEFKTWLSNNPLEVCYELATPMTVQLTPQEIEMYTGGNTVIAASGSMEISYHSTDDLDLAKQIEEEREISEWANNVYDSVQNRRLIFLENVGYFSITNVVDGYEDLKTYKDVTAKSVDNEIEQKMIPYIADGTYPFRTSNDVTGILDTIVASLPLWTIGTIDQNVASRWRTFEDVDTNLNCLSFLLQNVQDAYECIFVFDTVNRIINVYDQNNYVKTAGIHLTKKDLINSMTVTEDAADIYTAISVHGNGDVTIGAVNPTGTNTIYDFTYYLDWMSPSLSTKVQSWQQHVEDNKTNYYNLNLTYYEKLATRSNLSQDIQKLNTQIKMYQRCRNNIVAGSSGYVIDGYNEAIEENGGEPVVIYAEIEQTLHQIDGLIDACNSELGTKQSQLDTIDNQISGAQNAISAIRSTCSMTSYFTPEELEELSHYIYEGNYSDEYVLITDIMSYAEQFQQMKTLYDRAEQNLRKIAQPTQEYELDVESFLFEKSFEPWAEQLETGSLINVELDKDDVAALFLTNVTVNYDDHKMTMTFGNRYNRFDPKSLFESVLGNVNRSANSISFIKNTIYPIKTGSLNRMQEQIQSSRDLTMEAAMASENEEVIIDGSGYTGREKLEDGTYDPRQVKLTGKSMVFTDDAWESSKTAVGEIVLPDGSTTYGINAETVIGDLIIGNELHIKDSDGNDLLSVVDDKISTAVSGEAAARSSQIEQTANSINATISELSDDVDEHTEQIASISANVNGVTTRVSTVETTVASSAKTYHYYYLNNNGERPSADDSNWSNEMVWVDGLHAWRKTVVEYNNGTTVTGAIEDITGAQGATGAAGRSITGEKIYYQASEDGTTIPTGTWLDSDTNDPPYIAPGWYLWTKYVQTFSDGDPKTHYSVAGSGANGERGIGIYKITTAPTKYTTTVDGFTPAFRIPLSTVLSQGGMSKVMVGDTLEQSYNHYRVGYVDSSYVYLGAATSIRGATGARGATWYAGTAITGTSTTPDVFAGSGISSAVVGDHYLNTETQNVYVCTKAGNASTAQWKYEQNIKGEKGLDGGTGKDGATAYFHVKYSDDGGTTFTGHDGEDAGAYIGTYSDNLPDDSQSVSAYTWVKIEGDVVTATKASGVTTIKINGEATAQIYDGVSPTAYNLLCSDNAIVRDKTGTATPASITLSATSKTGTDAEAAYAGRFKIEYTLDGDTWLNGYTSSSNESSCTYNVFENQFVNGGPDESFTMDSGTLRGYTYSLGQGSTVFEAVKDEYFHFKLPASSVSPGISIGQLTKRHKYNGSVYSGGTHGAEIANLMDGAKGTITFEIKTTKKLNVKSSFVVTFSDDTPTLRAFRSPTEGVDYEPGEWVKYVISGAIPENWQEVLAGSNVVQSRYGISLYCGDDVVADEDDFDVYIRNIRFIYDIPALRAGLYLAGGTETLCDSQTIPVVYDGKDGADGTDGADAYTIVLTNESHTFIANSTGSAIANQTAECQVIAYKGTTQVAATIGSISGAPQGLTVTVSDNSTTSAKFTVKTAATLTAKNGVLTVPITVDEKTFNKTFTYSLATDGNGIQSITYHYATTTTQTAPSAASVTGTTIPAMSATNKYLWRKETISYTSSSIPDKVTVFLAAIYGDTGKSLIAVTEYYARNNSTTAPADTAFSTAIKTPIATEKYVWNYEELTWDTNGVQSTTKTDKHIVAFYGEKGADGKSLTGVTEYYAVNNSTTAPADSEFEATVKAPTSSNKYLWNYELLSWNDNGNTSTTKTDKHIAAVYGDKGDAGRGILSKVDYYAISDNGTNPDGSTSYRVLSESGNPIYVEDAKAEKVESLSVDLSPVQNLNGYDHPWVGGAGKNKLQITATSQTISGVTFTVNDDGTITASGTATANIVFTVAYIDFASGSYLLNGTPSGGSTSTYFIRVYNSNTQTSLNSTTSDASFAAEDGFNRVDIRVMNGVTVNNLVFKPMIRLSSITDATFEPYENICPIYPANGKNLLHISDFSVSGSGVTYTYDASTNTLTKSGTSSGSAGINTQTITVPNGTYALSADFSGESGSPTSIYLRDASTNTNVGSINAAAPELSITLNGTYYIRLVTNAGTTSGTISRFQLESGSATLYAPYQGIMVERCGKNLLNVTTTSRTINGVTFTVNSDGTILANGTASANISFFIANPTFIADNPSGTYFLSGCPNGGGTTTYRMSVLGATGSDIGNGVSVAYSGTITDTRLRIVMVNGTVCNNLVFKPMIRLASDTDSTFAPYIGTSYPFNLGRDVYGGTLDTATGVLTVTHGYVQSNSAADYVRNNSLNFYLKAAAASGIRSPSSAEATVYSDRYKTVLSGQTGIVFLNPGGNIRFNTTAEYNSVQDMLDAVGAPQFVYPLATPQTYNLTPQEIELLAGANSISTSNGIINLDYWEEQPIEWKITPETPNRFSRYLWNYEVTTYTDNTTDSTAKRVIGVYGEDGADGVAVDGKDGENAYFHIAWATNATGTEGFSTSDSTGKTYMGTYTDHVSADSTDPTKYSWVLTKGDSGVTNGYTILWNYESFTAPNSGEGYICAYDQITGQASDANGWVMWNGVERTITKQMINPNKVVPYNIPIYIVCRLASSAALSGTNYLVWYNGGWKYCALPSPSAVGGTWTWTYATDIILGKFVEPGSEAGFTDMVIYNPAWTCKQVTSDTVTAKSANAAASAAQSTANAANTAASNAQTTADGAATAASNAQTTADGAVTAASNAQTSADNANSKIDNLQIGGRNLLRDTKAFNKVNVPSTATGYLRSQGVVTTDESIDDFVVRTVSSTSAGSFGEWLVNNCKNGEIYTLSFWAKGNGKPRCYFYGPSGYIPVSKTWINGVLKPSNSSDGNSDVGGGGINISETEWTRVSITWELAASGGTTDIKYPLIRNDNKATIYVAGAKFEKGNRATDWTPAPEDVEANLNDNKIWYAECPTPASTTAKVATISPATTAFVLKTGAAVNVKFTNTNKGAVGSLTLNVNDTGAKSIKYYNNTSISNLSAAGQLYAGALIQFVYDGTYWVVSNLNYNSTYSLGNNQWYNTVKAETAIAAESIIAGDAGGYSQVVAGTVFDLSYPILWCTAKISTGATNYANLFTTIYDRNLSTCYASFAPVAGRMVYLVGTVSGNNFTVDSSILSCIEPTSADGKYYIPIGRMGDSYDPTNAVNRFYFNWTMNRLYSYIGGAFQPVDTAAQLLASVAQTTIDNLQIGGRNLLLGSKDASKFYYSTNGGGKTITQTEDGIKVDVTAQPASGSWSVVGFDDHHTKDIIESGSTYTVSFDFTVDSDIQQNISLNVRKGNGTLPMLVDKVVTVQMSANTKKRISITTTALETLPDVDNQHLYLSMPGLYSKVATFYVENLKFEKGNRATDWSPAPEDVNSKISAAQTSADTANNKIDNLQIGGRNMLRLTNDLTIGGAKAARPNDPATATGWYPYGTVASLVRTDYGIKVTYGTSGKDGPCVPLVEYDAIDDTETVTLSFDYRSNIAVSSPEIYLLCDPSPNVKVTGPNIIASETVWQHYSFTFSWPTHASRQSNYLLAPYFKQDGWVEIKDRSMKLEKGNRETAWSPAPEDTIYDRTRYFNNIHAAEAISADKLIVGNADGYKVAAAGVSFDITYPILWSNAALASGSDGSNNYLTIPSRDIQNNKPGATLTSNKTCYLVGALVNNTFTISDAVFVNAPTSADGLVYIPIGTLYSTHEIYFNGGVPKCYSYGLAGFTDYAFNQSLTVTNKWNVDLTERQNSIQSTVEKIPEIESSLDKLSDSQTKAVEDLNNSLNALKTQVTQNESKIETEVMKKNGTEGEYITLAKQMLDANGLHIQTSDTSTVSNIDGTGLTVTKLDGTVIAEFTTGNSRVNHLTSVGYFSVGSHRAEYGTMKNWNGTTVAATNIFHTGKVT